MTPEPQQQQNPRRRKRASARRRSRSPRRSAPPEVACRAPRSVLRKPRCQTDEQGDASSERSATLALLPALLVGGGIVGVASINASLGGKRAQLISDAESASSVDRADVVGALRRTSGTVVPQTIFLSLSSVSPATSRRAEAAPGTRLIRNHRGQQRPGRRCRTARRRDDRDGGVERGQGCRRADPVALRRGAHQLRTRARRCDAGLHDSQAVALGAANTCAAGAAAVDGGSNGPSNGSSSSGGAQVRSPTSIVERPHHLSASPASTFGDDARQAAALSGSQQRCRSRAFATSATGTETRSGALPATRQLGLR